MALNDHGIRCRDKSETFQQRTVFSQFESFRTTESSCSSTGHIEHALRVLKTHRVSHPGCHFCSWRYPHRIGAKWRWRNFSYWAHHWWYFFNCLLAVKEDDDLH